MMAAIPATACFCILSGLTDQFWDTWNKGKSIPRVHSMPHHPRIPFTFECGLNVNICFFLRPGCREPPYPAASKGSACGSSRLVTLSPPSMCPVVSLEGLFLHSDPDGGGACSMSVG